MKILLIVCILILPLASGAVEKPGPIIQCQVDLACLKGNCNHRPAQIQQIGNGHDDDLRPKLMESAKDHYLNIAPSLHLKVPNMVITHLTPSEMSALSMNAGHPAPIWNDGAAIVQGAKQASGILEFVVPGPVHHQYVRGTNTLHESLLVYAHVGGHYDFTETSPLYTIRKPDQIGYSQELAEFMSKIKSQVNYVEFSSWYHQLKTIENLQDISRGSYDSVESLKGKPYRPTQSVLQSFVANLPSTLEPWKVTMAELVEKKSRIIPAYALTQNMNEGWAVMMEYFILKYSRENSQEDADIFAGINSAVVVPNLANPYWLGFQAWKALREQFLKRAEIKNLTPIDQDAAFVDYAHEIIKEHTDYSFLRIALTQDWVEKHNFLLFRNEQVGDKVGKRTITRDPQRVANFIAQSMANGDFKSPKIWEMNQNENGIVVYEHAPVEGIPLHMLSIGPTLFQLARANGRPVKLNTIWNALWFNKKASPFSTGAMSVVVTPEGKVFVDLKGLEKIGENTQKEIGEIGNVLQASVDYFKGDLAISYDHAPKGSTTSRLETKSGEAELGFSGEFLGHAPTAPDAVLDYYKMTNSRRTKLLQLTAQGKLPMDIVNGKIRIQILPLTPRFILDTDLMKDRNSWVSTNYPTPVSRSGFVAAQSLAMPDEDLSLASGPYIPGDIFDIKKPGEGSGKGKGKGKGKKEPGEPDDKEKEGEGEGTGQGGGSAPPQFEDLPLEVYGQVLAEMIELRNLRRTGGESTRADDILIGTQRRSYGVVDWNKTAVEAIRLGKALQYMDKKKNGGVVDPKKKGLAYLMRTGMRNLPPSDYQVKSREPSPEPDFDAVIVFIADTSGSMSEEHRRIEKNMVTNQIALLKAKYPKLKPHFIVFADEAKEVSEAEFFRINMGGSTKAGSGFKLAAEILEKYPRAKFNRFVQAFSDGDEPTSTLSESLDEGKKLAEMTEFFGYSDVNPAGNSTGILSKEFAKESAGQPDKFGYADLTSNPESIFSAIRTFFGKN